jgi:hypothetical protein
MSQIVMIFTLAATGASLAAAMMVRIKTIATPVRVRARRPDQR